ncbi:hypothetical protein SAMN04487820_10543 [Actinopolyspora mzabensis]|uniref:Uncharacterized protein n=1 Tax=Actinopolyspora mzabensis TaxID=995066 RepID=A0A1G8ZPW9_ACTMZ|nr:hypothetical protein SAMN04487820_10543 [Actinopolyspora mzabensis]
MSGSMPSEMRIPGQLRRELVYPLPLVGQRSSRPGERDFEDTPPLDALFEEPPGEPPGAATGVGPV